ncbi:hypothetical protein LIER_16742 [Lithospermum erythrorhizon]|uniref:Uncharacterized protein n=1 Tax=Lithospermum erythrorhizon TaxID=34254 RepID=A0AAV3QAG1_LITER
MAIRAILSCTRAKHYLNHARKTIFLNYITSVSLKNYQSPPSIFSSASTSLRLRYVAPIYSREYHDGRPRGPLWRGKKLIGKEALFVVLGLKRFKEDEEKLGKFIKTHVLRLLKMDLIAVLTELERQEEVSLAIKDTGSFCFSMV